MLKQALITLATTVSLMFSAAGWALDRSPSPEGAQVYFVSPKDGDTVSGPITVVFGLKGMGVAPAGTNVKNTGHHHLLVNTGLPAADQPIPSGANHKHFGAGQTETTIELAPGTHTLQLLLGNFLHIPHDRPVASEVITISVK